VTWAGSGVGRPALGEVVERALSPVADGLDDRLPPTGGA